jgi:hypothetical protein
VLCRVAYPILAVLLGGVKRHNKKSPPSFTFEKYRGIK